MAEQDHLIFYDQECGFCRRMLRLVYRRDRNAHARLFPIALQDRATGRELGELSDEEKMESWHLKTPSGEVVSGGAAIAPLVELLELPRWLATTARAHPAATDRGYRWVAAHRKGFGQIFRWLPDFERR